jgi:large subunit ribosomal protein L7/L12
MDEGEVQMSQKKIEILQEKKARLAAQIQQIKSRESVEKRKAATRRKIILGGLVLGMLVRGERVDKNAILEALSASLSRPQDRLLFNLSPLPPAPPQRG